MFEKVNLTPMGIRVLKYLARSPGKEFYLREIAKALGISVGGCHKILKNLHEMNLIDKRASGRNIYYRIGERNPAVRHFKIFVNIQDLNHIVEGLKDKTRKIILFGSCATGEDTLESDIDLFIITEDVKTVKNRIERRIEGRSVKPVILAPHEFITLKKKDRSFYDEVNKGITLWRDTNE